MRVVVWLLRAFIFFTLFAFALNNQEPATVRWFFGVEWQAPMVIVVLAAFAAGCVIGVLAMLPGWWRQRREGALRVTASTPAPGRASAAPVSTPPSEFGAEHPPREGL